MSGFYKMIQVRPITIIHHTDNPGGEYWILDGIGKERGKALAGLGWEWIRGKPGCWQTTNAALVFEFAHRGIAVIESES